MIPCDYNENAGNDMANWEPANADDSGITYSGTRTVLCGNFNSGHYGMNGMGSPADVVDADGIRFNNASTGQVIVHLLVGNGLTNVDRTVVQILRNNGLYGFGVVEGDHGTFTFNLPGATGYVAAIYTINDTGISASIPYKMLISPDTARCPTKAGAADHPEAGDGGSNNGNDMIEFNFTANNQSSLTASTSDTPEVTNFAIDPAEAFSISGDLANVNPSDNYMDRDTYHFTTGPTTTQMSVRVNWPSTSSDLDFRIYPPQQSGIPESFVGGVDTSDMEDEYETFAVQPNTSYWLWVAAEDGATPTTYTATLCGETFTP
jgi:hypothetical protein